MNLSPSFARGCAAVCAREPSHALDDPKPRGATNRTQRTEFFCQIFGGETDVVHARGIGVRAYVGFDEYLAKKLCSLCPACGTPGFGIVERVTGLPCADCGAPTRETRAEVHGYLKCTHRETRERAGRQYADPGRCDYCNP